MTRTVVAAFDFEQYGDQATSRDSALKDAPLLWALGAAAIGYGIAWLVHGSRD